MSEQTHTNPSGSAQELRPCPFCGSAPVIRGWREGSFIEGCDGGGYIEERWWVSCEGNEKNGHSCVAFHMMEYSTREKAIEAWNTRATAPSYPPRRPGKVKPLLAPSGQYGDHKRRWECPNCGTVVGEYQDEASRHSKCPGCGQQLNWQGAYLWE